MVNAETLRSLLQYNPQTGVFTRRVSRQKFKAGETAGSLSDKGYIKIGINGRKYGAHQLAWLYMTGRWPTDQIDHRDSDRANNRFKNLREASSTLNRQNLRRATRNNTSGYLGVSWCNTRQKWVAQIAYAGKGKHLGYFDEPREAHEAYVAAKRAHHPGCLI